MKWIKHAFLGIMKFGAENSSIRLAHSFNLHINNKLTSIPIIDLDMGYGNTLHQ